MSFLDILNPDKSIFTDKSIDAALGKSSDYDGYAVIKITPSPRFTNKRTDIMEVVGVIQNEVNYTINATWEAIGGVGGITPNIGLLSTISNGIDSFTSEVNKIARNSGVRDVGSTFASRKVYSQSGYIDINPEIMIVDWKGTGQPVRAAIALATFCLPGEDIGKEFLDKLKSKVTEISTDIMQKLIPSEELKLPFGLENVLKDPVGAGLDWMSKNVTAEGSYLEDAGDFISLRNSPIPVQVKIGKYFHHTDMVINSVTFNFSKEVTPTGPLYLKATLNMSSRKIADKIADVGLNTSKLRKRSRIALV